MRWAGIGLVALAAAGAALRIHIITTFLTAIFWTGYILLADEAVYRRRGSSLIRTHPAAFAWMALLSVPLWVVFEAYNLRLRNWAYIGLPENPVVRMLGYAWAFATITPCILETADLLRARRRPGAGRPLRFRSGPLVAAGALALVTPLLAPTSVAPYLFGLVWLGFALLMDPLNARAGRPSVLADLRHGDTGRLGALLLAGAICGVLWEFCNWWATARWVYTFPILQQAKIFEMPLPGYLGFPPFAVEVFAMYVWAAGVLGVPSYEVK